MSIRFRRMKVVALVDGEHYPAVTRWGLASARACGYEVLAAVAAGGIEKLPTDRRLDLGPAPVIQGASGPMAGLATAPREHPPEAGLGLPDETLPGHDGGVGLIAAAPGH